MAPRALTDLAQDLASGRTTGRALAEAALARAADPDGEGSRVFTRIHRARALAEAAAQDGLRAHGHVASPLAGLPISIKDLFDVAGEPTPAGSAILADAPPAARDAAIVARLRAAGAVIPGRTNMTEFAFSGLGINPHYGTPLNPWDRTTGRIPGGSSSGAAVSVTDGMAAAAIGTDTGGSVRIPAALCGLAGFKPTARRVPAEGCLPLSTSLDSIGPLAPTVACCALIDAVLAGEEPVVPGAIPAAGLRLGVAQRYVLDDLEPAVAAAYQAALTRLSQAGVRLVDLPLGELEDIGAINATGGIAVAEAHAWHRDLIARHRPRYDQRVARRILGGAGIASADYIAALAMRRALQARVAAAVEGLDAWICPTVPMVAPALAPLEADDALYTRTNALMLRNPTAVNLLDGCALTLPVHRPGDAPVGLSLVGGTGGDRRLLAIGLGIEAALVQAA